VFGNGLWETTDGGEYWMRAAYDGGSILSLATIDGQVLESSRIWHGFVPAPLRLCSRDGDRHRLSPAWKHRCTALTGFTVGG
jgi:hypothetical protein